MRFLRSLLDRILTDNISFLAGGVAFYGMLALFPAMAGIVSLFGLLANPQVVGQELEAIRLLFPPPVFKILQEQLGILLSQPQATLSTTAIFGLLLTVYSATKGTKAMLAAINAVFRAQETRSWFYQQVESFMLTLGAIVLMIFAVFIIVAAPFLVKLILLTGIVKGTHSLESMRWLTLSAMVFSGLFILFAIGPNRAETKRSWDAIFWGAFLATALWVAIAVGGSVYMQISAVQFGSAYGSLSAIVLLMLWIYMSAYIVLMGGAITAITEEYHIARRNRSHAHRK